MLHAKHQQITLGKVHKTASHEDYPNLIDLDVGGKHIRTTRTTLAVPGSMLEQLVSKQWKEANIKGAVFVDRDPELFQIILTFLRSGTIDPHLPTDQDQRKRLLLLLQEEAEYFQLTDLAIVVTASLAQVQALALANFPPYIYVRFLRRRVSYKIFGVNPASFEYALVPNTKTYAENVNSSLLGNVPSLCALRFFGTQTASHEHHPDLIDLDVGGKRFRTTRVTFAVSGSTLERLVTEPRKESVKPIFIDRNPELFEIILDFLRSGTIEPHLPTEQDQRKRLLLLPQNEDEHFQLTDFAKTVTASFTSFVQVNAAFLAKLPEQMLVRSHRGSSWLFPSSYEHAILSASQIGTGLS
ncbi:hypothetical protein HK097_006789 [Rhizophlyctis rosea]|uniref:BTB domain-containing protein n=1 Tax=Rhizophlyctis rosea TaxID=64517 RepID=A0AAD5SM02_9FUNG|nr:hypothetical protein HK097_006789 [Rhizophlyctis rosea]